MNRRASNRMLAAGLGLAGAVVFGGCAAVAAGYRLNPTTSLPPGLWKRDAIPASGISRGSIVEFCPPQTAAFTLARDRGYIHGGLCAGNFEPLIKPIVALPGDVIVIGKAGVTVNTQTIGRSVALNADGDGASLPQIAAGTYTVAPGTVWVVSDFSRWSYDSRYFGAIPLDAIDGIMRPVWVESVPEAWR